MRYRRLIGATSLLLAAALAGCSTTAPTASTGSTTASSSTTPSSSRITPSTTPTSASASASATATAPASSATTATTTSTPAPDRRKGRQLRTPYTVNGIIVVSKKHRITAAYKPVHQTGSYGLSAPAAKALKKMTAAAKADGVRIRVHSGYRSWSVQNASYQRALRNYPQNIRYYAPAGASEHQTGLALDLWDGTTWSLPMATTATGKWLFTHAHEYGFILRYPKGKTQITGYEYEPWHYRYIGVTDAKKFGTSNRLTLEEYLGLA